MTTDTTPVTPERREWLILKGNHFYRPNKRGYTTSKTEAGRYSEADALREASIEPWHMSAVHQDAVPEDAVAVDLAAEVDRLKRERDHLRSELSTQIEKTQRALAKIDVIDELLGNALNDNEAAEAEGARLRAALIEAGRHVGAGLAEDVTTDLLMEVPKEVKLVVDRLKQERDAAEDKLNALHGKLTMVRRRFTNNAHASRARGTISASVWKEATELLQIDIAPSAASTDPTHGEGD